MFHLQLHDEGYQMMILTEHDAKLIHAGERSFWKATAGLTPDEFEQYLRNKAAERERAKYARHRGTSLVLGDGGKVPDVF